MIRRYRRIGAIESRRIKKKGKNISDINLTLRTEQSRRNLPLFVVETSVPERLPNLFTCGGGGSTGAGNYGPELPSLRTPVPEIYVRSVNEN